jgi:hypothetical protein
MDMDAQGRGAARGGGASDGAGGGASAAAPAAANPVRWAPLASFPAAFPAAAAAAQPQAPRSAAAAPPAAPAAAGGPPPAAAAETASQQPAAAPAAAGAPPPGHQSDAATSTQPQPLRERRFCGVARGKAPGTWHASVLAPGAADATHLGIFTSRVAAAREHDAAARARGLTAVNFPRARDVTGETLAPPDADDVAEPPRAGAPGTPRYKGVYVCKSSPNFHWMVHAHDPRTGQMAYGGTYLHAAAAARKHDALARAFGVKSVNFPREGEEQARAGKRGRTARAPAVAPVTPAAAAAAAAPEEGEPAAWAPASKRTRGANASPGGAPTPAPPAAEAQAEVASLLRGLSPPLPPRLLAAALAHLPASGITMTHLRHVACAAAAPIVLRDMLRHVTALLGAPQPSPDAVAFTAALLQLPRDGDGGGAAMQ